MQLIKRTNLKLILVVVFVAAFYLTRLSGLGYDNINPDSVNWHFRSEQFMNGLKFSQWEKTYQHYQPGVTFMWIMGPSVELVKQFYPGHEVYSIESFPAFHFFSKFMLVNVQLVLTLTIFWLLQKFVDWRVAGLAILLFTFEPFFIGNSRALHMDALLTLLLFVGLLCSFWSLKKFDWRVSALAGIFFGLAFLTKSIGIGSFLFAAGVGGLYLWFRESPRMGLRYAASILIPSVLTILIFLPALWVDPGHVIEKIYYEGVLEIGLEEGHGQIFFGEETRDPGAPFYPLVLALKSSPVLLLGLGFYVFSLLKRGVWRIRKLNITSYLAIFYLGYFVVMTIVSKKLDRYILPEYPFLALLAAQGYFEFKRYSKFVLPVLAAIFILWPALTLYPYYFTYTNPLFGSPQYVHENILAQKPFGLGVFELRDYIYENFGEDVRIGLIDPKPFFHIHDKDKLKYLRIDGTSSYEVLVLGVNEEMPGRIYESEYDFNYYGSIYINGLEYWKVYARSAEKK